MCIAPIGQMGTQLAHPIHLVLSMCTWPISHKNDYLSEISSIFNDISVCPLSRKTIEYTGWEKIIIKNRPIINCVLFDVRRKGGRDHYNISLMNCPYRTVGYYQPLYWLLPKSKKRTLINLMKALTNPPFHAIIVPWRTKYKKLRQATAPLKRQ